MKKENSGKRINRAYRFDSAFADFLADFSYATDITQTDIIEKAVMAYAQKNFPELQRLKIQKMEEEIARSKMLLRGLRSPPQSSRSEPK